MNLPIDYYAPLNQNINLNKFEESSTIHKHVLVVNVET
jgi:hypothetical protein